jgi:two-component system nitrate/nitrite response regulator NarL
MRVLVADDHSLFRDGIVSLLEAAGFEVVSQVGNGRAAVAAALRLSPDLILLDLTMPEMSGLEALAQIHQALPDTPIVMLTMSDDDADVLAAIKAGARGYLLKSLNAEEFFAMLEGLQRGEAAMTRQTTAGLLRGLSAPVALPAAWVENLTPRELDLLRLVAKGLPNKAIALALSVSENTVKYHLRSILQKLGAENRTEAVTAAIRSGLLDPTLSD